MRIVVRADDGDQITVNVDELATEQRIIRLELHNLMFDGIDDFEIVTLTVVQARELASAILSVAEALGNDMNDQQLWVEQHKSEGLSIREEPLDGCGDI
jgi:hypothetical protein